MNQPIWFKRFLQSPSVAARAARGGLALTAGGVVDRGLRLVRNVVLARLLAPDQFGLMALVLAASPLLEALSEVGIRAAVIQNRRGDSREFLNVAWWLGAARGLGLYVCGYLLAPWTAEFYGQAALGPLLRVALLALLFTGLSSPGVFALEKQLRFGRFAWVTQGAAVGGTASTIGLAYVLPNVWALVVGVVAEAGLRCVFSFLACPFWPRWRLDRASVRDLAAFARGTAGLALVTLVAGQADVFVLGRVCSQTELGMYALAAALATTPLTLFARVVLPLMLPVLSELDGDATRLRGALLQTTRVVFRLGLPLSAVVIILGRPLLALVYGPAYAAAAGVFAWLSVYALIYLAGTVLATAYTALGRPELHRRFALVRAAAVAVLMYPAARGLGPTGAAISLVLAILIAGVFQLATVRAVFDLPVRRYLATLGSGLPLAGLLALLAVLARWGLGGHPAGQVTAGALACSVVLAALLWRARGVLFAGIIPTPPVAKP